MRRLLIIYIVFVLLLCGCSKLPDTYPFLNQDVEIEAISLFYFPNPRDGYVGQEFEFIRDLESNEITPFMDEIRSLKTTLSISPPARGFGEYIVQVTYSDGSLELFGEWHIEYVESGGEITGVGGYNFIGDSFERLFLKYAGDFSHLKGM